MRTAARLYWKQATLKKEVVNVITETLNRYCLPVTSRQNHAMPQHRWKALVDHLREWRHPDREVEFTL